MKILLAAICVFGLLKPVLAAADSGVAILGAVCDRTSITFQIASGGCTSKETLAIRKLTDKSPFKLDLVRTKPDNCEAYLPNGMGVRYTYSELGLESGSQFQFASVVFYVP